MIMTGFPAKIASNVCRIFEPLAERSRSRKLFNRTGSYGGVHCIISPVLLSCLTTENISLDQYPSKQVLLTLFEVSIVLFRLLGTSLKLSKIYAEIHIETIIMQFTLQHQQS